MKIKLYFFALIASFSIMTSSFAKIEELNFSNYMFKLNSAQIAVVSFAMHNNSDDYNFQLRRHMRDASEFYEFNPLIKFYTVNVIKEPILVRQLSIKSYPTLVIYKFGQPTATKEGLLYLDEVLQFIDENMYN